MLEIQGVQKTFNLGTVNEKQALSGVDLTLNAGDFAALIGGNGAGKSTLLNAVAGMFPVDGGRILIDGSDVTALGEHKRARFLGRVFQDPMTGTAASMEIEENLALAARRGQKRTLRVGITKAEREGYREKLKTLGLGLEDRMTTKVGLLSGGQRQALTLLMATLKKPKLLLLDEPSLGLAPLIVKQIFEAIKELNRTQGLTVFLVEQNAFGALKLADRGYVMVNGSITMSGAGRELLADPEVRAAYLEGGRH